MIFSFLSQIGSMCGRFCNNQPGGKISKPWNKSGIVRFLRNMFYAYLHFLTLLQVELGKNTCIKVRVNQKFPSVIKVTISQKLQNDTTRPNEKSKTNGILKHSVTTDEMTQKLKRTRRKPQTILIYFPVSLQWEIGKPIVSVRHSMGGKSLSCFYHNNKPMGIVQLFLLA